MAQRSLVGTTADSRPGPHGRRRRWLLWFGVALVLLGALRVLAPELVARQLNRQLAEIGAYHGQVDDVDLALWRGGWRIEQLTIEKRSSSIDTPLLEVPRADLSVQWLALLRGEFVAEVVLVDPVVNFVQRRDDTQYGTGPDWRTRLEALVPIRVNRVEVRGGRIAFQNTDAEPPVDVYLSEVAGVVANLTNVRESSEPVFTGVDATARAMGRGPVRFRGRLDPLGKPPQFDLNLDLRGLPLTDLNPLLSEYAQLTAESGTFSLSAEVAAADGRFDGYVKPLLDQAAFIAPEDFRERPLGAIWDAMVATLAELLENQPRDRLGTRVPVIGELDPQLELWPAVGGVFRNMFNGLRLGLDDSIDLTDAAEDRGDQRDAGPEPPSTPANRTDF